MGKSDVVRNERIAAERQKGRTLADIGREFGLSAERVRGICAKIERRKAEIASGPWFAVLNVRAQNVLKNGCLEDKQDAIAAFSKDLPPMIPNCGAKTIAEIRDVLGICPDA
jgi:hypothetical protein